MSITPDISVVMSVYNGASSLPATIDSILSQQSVSLEFIIVDDGSTDQSLKILKEYARRDARVRLIQQENLGLTRALIKGCAAAEGRYIARQDAGDVSLPYRLMRQLGFIERHPNAAFASCATLYVGPSGEHLYEVKRNPDNATERLRTFRLDKIQGPSSHPSTIFRRSLYEDIKGYRSAFYFAQDIDLWIRLAERGQHVVMPDVLYKASFAVRSISGQYRREQIETARLILESARRRRNGLDDSEDIHQARTIRAGANRRTGRLARARTMYFIGMCLKKNQNPNSSKYFKKAFLTCPFHFKSALRFLLEGKNFVSSIVPLKKSAVAHHHLGDAE
jgi:glycosyltransferase involved in cell wall biosynthesis